MSHHSAEFCRGWLNGLREQARECTVVMGGDLPHVTQMSLIERADEIRAILAEAEAREASVGTPAEVIAAAEKAILQVGKWDAFTQREKGLMEEALALIAKWKEAR
jgi:hypothetical protein